MKENIAAKDVPLIPFQKFKTAARKVLSNTKKQSDSDIAKFQAANLKKRMAKKED